MPADSRASLVSVFRNDKAKASEDADDLRHLVSILRKSSCRDDASDGDDTGQSRFPVLEDVIELHAFHFLF